VSLRAIIVYCLLALAASWGIQYGGLAVLGAFDGPEAAPWLLASMWSPTIIALGFLAFHRPARRGLLWKPTLPGLPLALVAIGVPTLTAFGLVAVFEALGWGDAGWFDFAASGVTITGGPWKLGGGSQNWLLFVANVAATGVWFALLNLDAAVGEEFAWRGFLQGHMIGRLGQNAGLTCLGLFWSFWHLPALLSGYNYPEHPVLGALVLFPVTLVAMAFFYGWLTLRARSFWPAALAHGAANSIQIGVISNLKLTVPSLYLDLAGLVVSMLVGLLAWWALSRRQVPAEERQTAPA
jgi:membrane protease YdiL (CAAX protease family)